MRALLVTQCGLTVDAATELTLHGFRHVLVTAGVQLQRQGHVARFGLGTLGHWGLGSHMPGHYDNESGVIEFGTRDTIMTAFRGGWVPAWKGVASRVYAVCYRLV